jgi:uncharacterized protein YndB with AHSA1/START domain
MNNDSEVTITVDAPAAEVWNALINPILVEQYMMGTHVESDYKVGAPIHWRGEINGKPYDDSGKILACEPNKNLGYSHTSGGATHEISIDLSTRSGKTDIRLIQTKNVDSKDQSTGEKFWKQTLEGLKKITEQKRAPRASA